MREAALANALESSDAEDDPRGLVAGACVGRGVARARPGEACAVSGSATSKHATSTAPRALAVCSLGEVFEERFSVECGMVVLRNPLGVVLIPL